MRMRGFSVKQKIKIILDKQVQNDLPDLKDRGYNYQDELNYVFKNQTRKIAEDNVTATRCMLRNVVRNRMIMLLLTSPGRQYFEAYEPFLFDVLPTEPAK